MSETQHTAGPWNVGKSSHDRLIYADTEHAFDLAIVRDGGNTAQLEANASLIAAAPDLLAACVAWVDYFEKLDRDCEPDDPIAIARRKYHAKRMDASRAAIAKAKGTEGTARHVG